ncbi:MAG: single-stranded DNA-binding protein [Edaphobacter sp.]|jgi:single-strand DNA-binding protein
MPQQNLFPHEATRGKQPQRVLPKNNAAQPPAHMALQPEPNRQTGEPQGRYGYPQQQAQPYRQQPNRAAALAPAARSASPENGRVRLFGWIGRYFEVKRTQSGRLRATFSIATPRTLRDQAGNPQKTTVWQRIVVWGESAKALDDQLHTGARVHVEGTFKTREWTDSENILHTTTELVARSVRFLDEPGQDTKVAA